ncbi:MAG: PASTA domain-containing protein, partial [Actinomycetota bacterium]|nr:PASTA domain-containing protein [Actinomycetota bacterium]
MNLWDRLAAANAARRADWDWVKAERAAHRAGLSSERPTMTLPTAPQPLQSPLPSAQDYQWSEGDTCPTVVSSAASVPTSRRKWPWVVGGAVSLLLIIGIANIGSHSSTPTVTAAPPQVQAPLVSSQITLPTDLVGKNAQLADEQLRNLGIVNIRYVSQDAAYKVVAFLAKWTVTRVEPAPGAVVSIDDTVVVTATRKAGSMGQQPASPPARATPPAPIGAAPAGQQPAPASAPTERDQMPIEQTVGPQSPAPQPAAPQPAAPQPAAPQPAAPQPAEAPV